ncbi:hypothetical protein D9M69_383980 [compost metagenome]
MQECDQLGFGERGDFQGLDDVVGAQDAGQELVSQLIGVLGVQQVGAAWGQPVGIALALAQIEVPGDHVDQGAHAVGGQVWIVLLQQVGKLVAAHALVQLGEQPEQGLKAAAQGSQTFAAQAGRDRFQAQLGFVQRLGCLGSTIAVEAFIQQPGQTDAPGLRGRVVQWHRVQDSVNAGADRAVHVHRVVMPITTQLNMQFLEHADVGDGSEVRRVEGAEDAVELEPGDSVAEATQAVLQLVIQLNQVRFGLGGLCRHRRGNSSSEPVDEGGIGQRGLYLHVTAAGGRHWVLVPQLEEKWLLAQAGGNRVFHLPEKLFQPEHPGLDNLRLQWPRHNSIQVRLQCGVASNFCAHGSLGFRLPRSLALHPRLRRGRRPVDSVPM